ncbi:MAG: IS30 family transposase [Pseudomonadota bacterium]
MKRNAGSRPDGYRPAYARQQAGARRWSGSRLERNAALRERVLGDLARGFSPAQVVGRLQREIGRTLIACESIYRFVYAQLRRTNDGAWRRYLPRAKARRGWRPGKGGSPASFIERRVPLDQRPQAAADRREPGHWETDFMLFSRYGQSVLVLHERATRLTTLFKNRQPQGGAHGRSPRQAPAAAARVTAPIAHLRQRDRVRRASQAQHRSRPGDLLLRSSLALAEGRRRNAIGHIRKVPAKTN